MNTNIAQIKMLHIFATYGEIVALRESIKTLSYVGEKDNITEQYISKQKYFKLIKHKFREDFPEKNEEMLNLLSEYQNEREIAKRKYHKALSKTQEKLSSIQNIIGRVIKEFEDIECVSKRGFIQTIEEAGKKKLLEEFIQLDTSNVSQSNLKTICKLTLKVSKCVPNSKLLDIKENSNHGLQKVRIYLEVSNTLYNAATFIMSQMSHYDELSTLCPKPAKKCSSKQHNTLCTECKGKGYVDEIVDHDYDYNSVWERRECETCREKGLLL